MAELTRSAEKIVVTLGPGSDDPSERLRGLGVVDRVAWEARRREASVHLRLGGGTTAEAATTAVLDALLKSGVSVASITRGERLLERFLKETGSAGDGGRG
jgi:hypothetical protein